MLLSVWLTIITVCCCVGMFSGSTLYIGLVVDNCYSWSVCLPFLFSLMFVCFGSTLTVYWWGRWYLILSVWLFTITICFLLRFVSFFHIFDYHYCLLLCLYILIIHCILARSLIMLLSIWLFIITFCFLLCFVSFS